MGGDESESRMTWEFLGLTRDSGLLLLLLLLEEWHFFHFYDQETVEKQRSQEACYVGGGEGTIIFEIWADITLFLLKNACYTE